MWNTCRFLNKGQWHVVNTVTDNGRWIPGLPKRAFQNVCIGGSPCSEAWLSASQVQEFSTATF